MRVDGNKNITDIATKSKLTKDNCIILTIQCGYVLAQASTKRYGYAWLGKKQDQQDGTHQ